MKWQLPDFLSLVYGQKLQILHMQITQPLLKYSEMLNM